MDERLLNFITLWAGTIKDHHESVALIYKREQCNIHKSSRKGNEYIKLNKQISRRVIVKTQAAHDHIEPLCKCIREKRHMSIFDEGGPSLIKFNNHS